MTSIVARHIWGMPGPLGPPINWTRVRGTYIHHTAGTATTDPKADAIRVARIGINRFGRASYSYLIGRDGTIFEMQAGHIGAHTKGHNSTSEAICFVGNYEHLLPTDVQLDAAHWLVQHNRDRWPDGVLGGHRDAPGAATACPGRHLQARLQNIRTGVPVGQDDIMSALPVTRRRTDLGRATDTDRRVQGLLTAAGILDLGPVNVRDGTFDGKFGPSTERAVREFQHTRRLPVTGVVDTGTWRALLGVR